MKYVDSSIYGSEMDSSPSGHISYREMEMIVCPCARKRYDSIPDLLAAEAITEHRKFIILVYNKYHLRAH